METYKLVFYLVPDFYPHVASVFLPASLIQSFFFWFFFFYIYREMYNSLRGLRHAATDPNQVWLGLPPCHPLPTGQSGWVFPSAAARHGGCWHTSPRHTSFIDTHLQVLLLLFSSGINYTSSLSRGRMVHLHLYQSRVHFSTSPPNGLQNKFQFWFPLSFQPN